MPEWLLSVISGILAGGIPGFRIELCCFFHPLAWPLGVVPCCFCFASFSVAILKMTHKMSSCILFLRAGSCPTSLCFVVLVFVVVLSVFLFVCLVGVLCFDGTAHWTVYRSITSALLRLSTFRRPCMIIYKFIFLLLFFSVQRLHGFRQVVTHIQSQQKLNCN